MFLAEVSSKDLWIHSCLQGTDAGGSKENCHALNGELEEELYMSSPDGDAIPPGHRWHLRRSLYGLKQAGRT
jgi:hypothetical protein